MKDHLRTAAKRSAGAFASVVRRVYRAAEAGSLGILAYHRLVPRMKDVPEPSINVTPQRFAAQMRGLLKKRYKPITLSRALALAAADEPFPRKSFVVTFDDGFETVYHHAWPVLKELNIPATIFLCTQPLGTDEPFWFDRWAMRFRSRLVDPSAWRTLRAEQLADLNDDNLISFGAHTHTHADFRGDPTRLFDDLSTNVELLRRDYGVDQPPFAFPFGKPRLGYTSEDLVRAAQAAGVSCALTTQDSVIARGQSPFGWGRFNVYQWDTAGTLAGKVDGWYGRMLRRANQSRQEIPSHRVGHLYPKTLKRRRDVPHQPETTAVESGVN